MVVADLNGDNAATVAEELGGPDKAVAVTVDVTDEDQITEAFRSAASRVERCSELGMRTSERCEPPPLGGALLVSSPSAADSDN